MRSYLQLAAVAASALAVALPMTAAEAATAHVLTINKTGGSAVKVGAVLKSGLATGKTAVFSLGSGSTAQKVTCKAASVSAKVVSNPVKPGKAAESLTALSFSSCTVNVSGVTFKSLKSLNLPYGATVSDASGDPVKVAGSSTSKPVSFTASVAALGSTITCTFHAASVSGHASNTGSTISFANQKFVPSAGNNAFCPSAAFFTATFGPVKDTSVTGSPKVFVN